MKNKRNYSMRSAWRVRFPNRCEENIIVLLPRSRRSRSNRSIERDRRRFEREIIGRFGYTPCSAVGSKLAEGSSKSSKPGPPSDTTERMNVRDLRSNPVVSHPQLNNK